MRAAAAFRVIRGRSGLFAEPMRRQRPQPQLRRRRGKQRRRDNLGVRGMPKGSYPLKHHKKDAWQATEAPNFGGERYPGIGWAPGKRRATFRTDALGRAVTDKAEAAAVMLFNSDISLRRAAWLARQIGGPACESWLAFSI